MKRILLVAVLALLPGVSAAQVFQSGAVTAGDCANWAGTNLIADSGAACNAAAGSNTQLQRNNSGALGGISGATSNGTLVQFAPNALSLSGSTSGSSLLNAPAIGGGTATFPTGSGSLAYSISSGQTKVLASSGGDFTSLAGWLSYLNGLTFTPGASTTLTVNDGTYSSSSTFALNARFGQQITIQGQHNYAHTLTSIVSSSGTSGSYSIVLQLGEAVTNITANNDYIVITNASSGTNPTYMDGIFPVTAVNTGSNQVTVTSTSRGGVPSGAVTANISDLPSVLKFTGGVDGIDVWSGGSALNLQNVVIVGDGTGSGNGLSVQDVSRLYISTVGVVGVYDFGGCSVLANYNAEINGGTIVTGNSQSVATDWSIYDGAVVNVEAISAGNASTGFNFANGGKFDASPGTGATGNGGYGFVANHAGLIRMSPTNTFATGNTQWGCYADDNSYIGSCAATVSGNGAGGSSIPQRLENGLLLTNGSINFGVTSTGVGINTQTPSYFLDIEAKSNGSGYGFYLNDATRAGTDSVFHVTGASTNQNFDIFASGKVGIGTTSPGGMLEVNGTAKIDSTLTLSALSSPGLLVNNASGAVSSVATVTTATTPANFSAATYLSVNIGGTTYYIPANTTTW